jgi:hypothetical protein
MSHLLYRQCILQNIPVQWWYEEDVFVIEPLRRFADEMVRGDRAAIVTFQEGATVAVTQWQDPSVMHITDSYLPGFFWLRHLYSIDELRAYADRLWVLLAPLQPVIVYCHGDAESAFRRATRQRGRTWARDIVDHVKSWQVPRYPGRPLKTQRDVVRFWSWLDDESRALLDYWPGRTLTLESTATPESELAAQLLGYFGIPEVPTLPSPSAKQLQDYLGVYARSDSPEQSESTIVELRDEALFVRLYWPSGSVLVAEQVDFFRLGATSRTITFTRDSSGVVDGFLYATWRGTESYARLR